MVKIKNNLTNISIRSLITFLTIVSLDLTFQFLSIPFCQAETFVGSYEQTYSDNDGVRHFLIDGNGNRYSLEITPPFFVPPLNATVVVDGTLNLGTIKTKTLHIQPFRVQVKGARRALVIPLSLDSDPASPTTLKTLSQLPSLFNSSKTSLSEYFKEISYGLVSFNFEFTEPKSVTADIWNTITIPSQTDQFLKSLNINSSNYDHVLLLLHSMSPIGNGGGPVGKFSYYELNFDSLNLTMGVFAHEMLHNFGLLHASALTCRNSSNPDKIAFIGDSCARVAYYDHWSVMGTGYLQHPHQWDKWILGWLDQSQISSVLSSGIYDLSVSALKTGKFKKALTLPRGKVPHSYGSDSDPHQFYDFWLELRAPVGFERKLGPEYENPQVLVYLAPRYPTTVTDDNVPQYSDVLQPTIKDPDLPLDYENWVPLRQKLVDAGTGISFEVVAITGKGASATAAVKIDIPGSISKGTAPVLTKLKSSPNWKIKKKIAPFITTTGVINNCTITPDLPKGLNFNPRNCRISGAARKIEKNKSYTILAWNSYGYTTTSFNAKVQK